MAVNFCYFQIENCKVFKFHVSNSSFYEISTPPLLALSYNKHRTLKLQI